ncbi:baseplate protein J [Nostoc sp. FACHB-110]|uniref:baseplate protein J n=1 Tax=Nostoc sp. FACHB-110 TaxID=2692834 RepID=UPI001688C387|nr:baseplate protein J [Nostoc sp. FACHB-110]MBD2438753.1 baseplate protein J [Nostoc sp. FACHB-110]
MALPLPNLDDRTYNDLVEEAIAQIPLEYPDWTDHNPTDTGIILIELLAWLTEMVLYRVNQITDENYVSFVNLLREESWQLPINIPNQERQQILQSEIQNTLLKLRQVYRAVTPEDFENLVLVDWNKLHNADAVKIARVKCLASRNLESNATSAKGHISLVVVPENNSKENQQKNKYQKLLDFLNGRKLLTTRLHIVEADYVSLTIDANLVLQDGAKPENVRKQAEKEVEMFFEPLNSQKYWQGKGWPFGQSVYRSALYKLLDDLEGVDYVKALKINQSESDVYLQDNQLVKFDINNSKFKILVAFSNELKPI